MGFTGLNLGTLRMEVQSSRLRLFRVLQCFLAVLPSTPGNMARVALNVASPITPPWQGAGCEAQAFKL